LTEFVRTLAYESVLLSEPFAFELHEGMQALPVVEIGWQFPGYHLLDQ